MIQELQAYKAYKESDIPWLGRVPAHWEVVLNQRILKEEIRPYDGQPETQLSLSQKDGLIATSEMQERSLQTSSFDNWKLTLPGDLVLNRFKAHLGVFFASNMRGIVSFHYGVFVPRRPMVTRYFELLYHTNIYRTIYAGRSNGMTVGLQNLSNQNFYSVHSIVPPIDEQVAIVRFLDHADHRIRRYIFAKQKLIKLLEEQKRAIIHRAVTRGLDPNVRLKPSGVAWLGDVPEHWEIKRSRYLFREVDVRSTDGSEEHLSMSQRLGLVPSHLVENRTLVSESYAGGKLCEVGDLVLNRLKAHLGVFAISRFAGVISPDYTVLRSIKHEDADYFELVLRGHACRHELRIRAKGIVEGFWRLYTDDFYDIRLPVPPPQERRAIIDALHSMTSEINNVVRRMEQEVSFVREYRDRLIADVVTGKLDVRNLTANLPDQSGMAGELSLSGDDVLWDDEEVEPSPEEMTAQEDIG